MAINNVIHGSLVPLSVNAATLKPGHVVDALHERASKLNALLAMTYGNGQETFRTFSEALQDDYLWACADIAREIRDLLSEHMDLLNGKTPA